MKLSAFSILDTYPPEVTGTRDRYEETLQLAEACEQAGLSALWVAEHHFHSGGTCPSPPLLLAAAAMRTRVLRLGALVSVLPLHNPIEIAEEYALADRLSAGRLNFGAGSGYIPIELQGFGVDPATKRERFDRSLATILAAWRGEETPVAGVSVRLNVRPVQQPNPPLWIAVQRREAIPFVGRRGANLALIPYATVESIGELGEEISEYRRSVPPGTRGSVGVALHLYAGSDPDRARTAFQRYLDSRLTTQSSFYAEKVRRDPRHARGATAESIGFALFGIPEDVLGKLTRFRAIGVDEIFGIFDFGGLPVADVLGSVRELGSRWGTEGPGGPPSP